MLGLLIEFSVFLMSVLPIDTLEMIIGTLALYLLGAIIKWLGR